MTSEHREYSRYTVGELKAALAEFPDETPVMVRGHAAGFVDSDAPRLFKIKLDHHTRWEFGPHEVADGEPGIDAVVIASFPPILKGNPGP